MDKKEKFPRSCCVFGCPTVVHSRQDANKLFPFVSKTRSDIDAESKKLIRKRFWEWIKVLGQKPYKTETLWVCRNHFQSGQPATHHWDKDWIPNLNLPTTKKRSTRASNEALTRKRNNENKCSSNQQIIKQTGVDLSINEGPVCRLCLRKHKSMKALFPSLHIFICIECFKKLEDFHAARNRWKQNDELLRAVKKDSYVTPVPIERLLDDPETNMDASGLYNNEISTDPMPIVAIPIEHLMEDKETETEGRTLEEQNSYDCKNYISTAINHKTEYIEQSDVSLPVTQSTVNDYLDLDTIETDTEEMQMIKELIEEIRRETLSKSPVRKRHKKRSQRSKKRSSCLVDLPNNGNR